MEKKMPATITGFKAFENKIKSNASISTNAANQSTETETTPLTEPEKTVEPNKEKPETK